MKITSWNVNGVRAIVKKDFEQNFQLIQPDIMGLQETKAQINEVKLALNFLQDSYHIYPNQADKKGYSGTALISKNEPIKIFYGMQISQHDNEGRVITAEYQDFFLVNVYTPNAGQGLKRLDYKKEWNADFESYIKQLDLQKPVILMGDLNVAHQAIDLKNDKSNYNKTAGYTQVEIDGMTHLLKNGFTDVFRHLHPDEVAYTYWSYRFNARAKNTGWRIDYFLVSNRIIDKISNFIIHKDILGADHCPISIEIDF